MCSSTSFPSCLVKHGLADAALLIEYRFQVTLYLLFSFVRRADPLFLPSPWTKTRSPSWGGFKNIVQKAIVFYWGLSYSRGFIYTRSSSLLTIIRADSSLADGQLSSPYPPSPCFSSFNATSVMLRCFPPLSTTVTQVISSFRFPPPIPTF